MNSDAGSTLMLTHKRSHLTMQKLNWFPNTMLLHRHTHKRSRSLKLCLFYCICMTVAWRLWHAFASTFGWNVSPPLRICMRCILLAMPAVYSWLHKIYNNNKLPVWPNWCRRSWVRSLTEWNQWHTLSTYPGTQHLQSPYSPHIVPYNSIQSHSLPLMLLGCWHHELGLTLLKWDVYGMTLCFNHYMDRSKSNA